MKKKENKKKALVMFMLIIFVLSTVGSVVIYYSGGDQSFTRNYGENKYKFKQMSDNMGNLYYEVKYNSEDFISYFLPDGLSLFDETSKNLIKNSNYFYFAIDPNDPNIQLLDFLRFDLRNNIPAGRFFFDSVTSNTSVYNLPKVSCQNSTVVAPVIIVKSSNITKVQTENSCITVEFTSPATLQVRDSLVYILNGVEI